MSLRQIELAPNARSAIKKQALYYIKEFGEHLAARWLVAVDASIQELSNSPEGGALFLLKNDRLTGLRRWSVRGFQNHFLIYRYEESRYEKNVFRLLIVDALHGARDLINILPSRLRETE